MQVYPAQKTFMRHIFYQLENKVLIATLGLNEAMRAKKISSCSIQHSQASAAAMPLDCRTAR